MDLMLSNQLLRAYNFKYSNSILHSPTLFLLIGLIVTPFAWANSSSYNFLIQQARTGDSSPAIDYFRGKAQQTTLNANELADWLEVTSWSSDDKAVVQLWNQYGRKQILPSRGYAVVAKAYRNLKDWKTAIYLWRRAISTASNNDDLYDGLIMTLADAGRDKEALERAQQRALIKPNAQRYLTLTYVHQQAGREYAALESATSALESAPQNSYVIQTYIYTLDAARANAPASLYANRYRQNISNQQWRYIEASAAAQLVRLSFLETRSEKERFYSANKALVIYDRLLTTWRDDPQAHDAYMRARIDRLGALAATYQMKQVADEYQVFLSEQVQLPDYALRWVASAYLWLQQPDKAAELYDGVYQREKNQPSEIKVDDISMLFTSLVEDERLSKAQQLAEQPLPPYNIQVYLLPTVEPNPDWLDMQQLRAQNYLVRDNLPAAEQLLTNLSSTAATNQDLRISLASIWLARGWPRKAESELKKIEGLAPRNIYLEQQQGRVALELQEWYQLDLLADDVMQRAPEQPATQRLDRLRQVRKMSELRISGAKSLKSDNPSNDTSGKGDKSNSITARLYSPPINDNWRLFSGWSFGNSTFEEGHGVQRNVLVGAEWTSRDYWAEVEASNRNYGQGNKIGLRFSGWHDFSDIWRVGGRLERLATDTPLRALKNKVSVNGGDVWLRYRQNELRQWQLGLAPSRFSDGNRRMEYSLLGAENLLTLPRVKLDLNLELSASHNSKKEAPYYNPKRDATVLPSVAIDHMLYRRYQTQWSQQATLGAGSYFEKNYSSGLITQVGYGQRLKLNDVFDAGATLTWSKRPYDGKREQNVELTFDLNYRF